MSRIVSSPRAFFLLGLAVLLAVAGAIRAPMALQAPVSGLDNFGEAVLSEADPLVRAVMKMAAMCQPSGGEHEDGVPGAECPLCSLNVVPTANAPALVSFSNSASQSYARLADQWRLSGLLPAIPQPRGPPSAT